jgi:Asp-tRNA(Asn)/Glu-tRNA(Gln) amidotransferase A subunit family amidase
MARAADAAGRAGAHVARLELPPEVNSAFDAHPTVMNGESAQALAWELAHHRAKLSDLLLERIDRQDLLTGEAVAAARDVLALARQAFAGLTGGFDAILTPSAAGEAPEGLGWTGDPAFNSLWTALRCPCVTVPAGVGPKGLPLGLQIVAPAGKDSAALRWAAWMQDVLSR